ncbi:MAG: peptide chain release factor N(5)-glutamine methyltransferase [Opitutia bacterium]
MQTLLEALRKSAEFLARKGLERPRVEAEHVFAAALGLKRLDLYLQFERPLTAEEEARLRGLIVRRGNREPLQHVVGRAEFRGLTLRCDARALVPRPETEELVDLALALFPADREVRALDLGTGTGAIALALAAERPAWRVSAVDRSPEALALARENAAACGLAGRVELAASDWFSEVRDAYDLVVSNPPYLTEAELATAEPEVREHDPRSALVAAEDGIADLRRILTEAPKFLRPGGWVLLETGTDHHPALTELSARLGYAESGGLPDLSGRPRFWKARHGA